MKCLLSRGWDCSLTVAALWVVVVGVVLLLGGAASPAGEVPSGVYSEYDREFRTFLAQANKRVGKEVIKVERLSKRFTVPQKLKIKGTAYEIGLCLGQVGRQAKVPLPMLAATNRVLNQKVIKLYQAVFPQHLDLVRGVAEVYKQPAEDIDVRIFEVEFSTRLWTEVLKLDRFDPSIDSEKLSAAGDNHHCSTASYYVGGRHLVGRNFDNPSDRPHYFTTLETPGNYKVMGHTIYDITSWVVDGINEKGLTFCVTTSYGDTEAYPDEPAILLGQMCQIVMQTCATVDEALALLRRVRVWFPFEVNHCLIADATGNSVVVEWNPKDYKLLVFDKPGRWELLTNTPLENGEDALVKSCSRYRDARPLLETGLRNSKDLLEAMKVMRITSGGARTLWTSIMDLNERTFEVRYLKEFERSYKFKF